MIVRFKEGLLVRTAESEEERTQVESWGAATGGHVLTVVRQDPRTLRMTDLGPEADAFRAPINVTSRSTDPRVRLISNFAETPFELADRIYASVEAFCQGLKFPDEARREEVAMLSAVEAKKAASSAPESDLIKFNGRTLRVATYEHWELMRRACEAKFTQDREAREALLVTGERPLTHRTRRDSRTIPGVIMAEIWMTVRKRLRTESDEEALLPA